MLAGFLLAMREGVEAALIIGIVLSTLRKINRGTLSLIVWRGVLAAGGFSLLAGLVLFWLGVNFEGRSEEIFEGAVMLAAAGLLTWMIFWMRRHSATLLKDLADDVRKAAITKDSPWALFWLSFLAVGREGFELALFLVASQMATGSLQTFLGATSGDRRREHTWLDFFRLYQALKPTSVLHGNQHSAHPFCLGVNCPKHP